MAVVATATVVHRPFPVRVQRASLEPDGLAYSQQTSTGDGSGGNVLHTFRGQAGFLYILRAISAEMDEDGGVNSNPDVELRLVAAWLARETAQTDGNLFTVLSMANVGPTGGTNRRVASSTFIGSLLDYARNIFLGTIQRTGNHDILGMNHRENVLNNIYVSSAVFDVYRTEALTVPAILNQLRAGLIR